MTARTIVRSVLGAAIALIAAPAVAHGDLTDAAGRVIPNTSWAGTTAQVAGPPSCAGGPSASCSPLASPASPADDDPAALAALGSPGSPEDDLAAALSALAAAPDSAAAGRARDEALAILEGQPLPGRAYSGIPLLNYNAGRKVRAVPAGGTVDVTLVNLPGRTLSDTWLLRFDDADQPYTIRYHVSELGGAVGGTLAPTPLLTDGDRPIGGLHSALLPLGVAPLATGTRDASRFTTARGLPAAGAGEQTRQATQVISIRMPPARHTSVILQPETRPTGGPLTVRPATDARIAAALAAMGLGPDAPTAADRDAAIRRLGAAAPERVLWEDLRGLPAQDDPVFLDAARGVGGQDGQLVGVMRTPGQLPPGVAADPAADVTVLVQNNETYVSRARVRVPAGAPLRVEVINRDGVAHGVEALALHTRRAVLGADDWGRFDWDPVATPGGPLSAHRPPDATGASRVYEIAVPGDAFAVAIGDPDAGDQATAIVELDRGPRTESTRVAGTVAAHPLHQAVDADGRLWVTLAGMDAVVRVAPGEALDSSVRTTALIPGGRHTITGAAPLLGPGDIAVDERGIVWATLGPANAIARIDPDLIRDGTTAGVRVYPLTPCGDGACAVPFPPEPGAAPTREPLQLEVGHDARGDALVWFTESAADRIGLLRVAGDGTERGQTHFPCGCQMPAGLGRGATGDVWFTETISNRLGRLRLDVTQPYAASAATLDHFDIPSWVPLTDPEVTRTTVPTSSPHSLAVDARGLVWFTEAATGKLGVLDPGQARAGTTEGMAEFALPLTSHGAEPSPADLTVDRAGTVVWADEYGDAVGLFDARGARDSWRVERILRPAARRSMTDSPVLASSGDLYVIENGAGLLTRIAGVTAGSPVPAAPPVVGADLSADALTLSGLRETDAVRVDVVRDGRVTAHGEAAVRDGAARIGADDWTGAAADRLAAGDALRVALAGAHPRAPLTLTLPDVAGRRAADGTLTGHALLGGRPLDGPVVITDGAAREAAVDPADGGWRLPAATRTTDAPATVSWTATLPAARVRTTSTLAEPAATPPSPPAEGVPDPAPPTRAPAPPASPSTEQPAATKPGRTPTAKPTTTCPPRTWLSRSAGRAVPAFLGQSERAVRACAGGVPKRAQAGSAVTLRWATGLTVTLRGGRVESYTITGTAWTSATGGLRVGAAATAIDRALPGARIERDRGTARAVVRLAGGAAADVRLRLDRAGRVTRIVVRALPVQRLDAAGRRLLEARP